MAAAAEKFFSMKDGAMHWRSEPVGKDGTCSSRAPHRFLPAFWLSLLLVFCEPLAAWGQYSIQSVPDPNDSGNWEYQMDYGGFHFGTVIVQADSGVATATSPGLLIARLHPDQINDAEGINGWGSSYQLNPFLSNVQPSGGTVTSSSTDANGIEFVLGGPVKGLAPNQINTTINYGTFTLAATFSYNPTTQKVTESANLAVSLSYTLAASGTAGADLDLGRITSNYLTNVPLQGGGTDNTGDMSAANVSYGAGYPYNFIWLPGLSGTGASTSPTDKTNNLNIGVIGTINRVDGVALGQGFLAVAAKPTMDVTTTSTSFLSVSANYNTTEPPGVGQDPYADNIGIVQQVLKGNAASATAFQFSSTCTSVSSQITWIGATSGSWTTGSNWQVSSPPKSGYLLQFGPGNNLINDNDFSPGTQFNGITFSSSASAYTLTGNSIQLGGPILNQSGDNQTLGLPMTLVAGGGAFDAGTEKITVSGNIDGNRPLSLNNGTLLLSGSNSYTGGTTVSSGTLEVASPAALPSEGIINVGRSGAVSLLGLLVLPDVASPNVSQASIDTVADPSGTLAVVEIAGQTPAGGGGTSLPDVGSMSEGITLAPVPEPSTLALLGVAAAGLLAYAWRRQRIRV